MPRHPGRNGQAFGLKEFRIEEFGLVAIAVVAEHGHDGVAGAEVLGEPNGAGNVDRGRAAEAKAFFLYQVEDVGQRFGIADPVG